MVNTTTEYESIYSTVTLNSKLNGPSYRFIQHGCEKSHMLTGYIYYIDNEKSGDHAYVQMLASNYGVNMINGNEYAMDDDPIIQLMVQIYDQWDKVDIVSKEYFYNFSESELFSDCRYKTRTMLIRERIPSNNYQLILPEMKEDAYYNFHYK